ncbi:ets-related transcription factor elf-3 [Plakobranchus ocellatus]|uniref:Ets-related transcription factor elf-3 n=1 Tax=Plakobranchus ocellatus TaxID=259542 RepID=A0AAV3YYT3_9GAST|nr:ets-related transcription factor elf-3 [Plakobranchus ocellatus]
MLPKAPKGKVANIEAINFNSKKQTNPKDEEATSLIARPQQMPLLLSRLETRARGFKVLWFHYSLKHREEDEGREIEKKIWFLSTASPQQGGHRLSGLLLGQGGGSKARIRNRLVPRAQGALTSHCATDAQ